MKILQIIYNKETSYIFDVLKELQIRVCIEQYNIDHHKEKKKALPIMTRHGTPNVPLIVFKDENLEEYAAIWSESNPDWLAEINKILNE